MTELAPIDLLRFVAQLAVEHGGEQGAQFFEAVAEYISGARHGLTFDQALGLAPDGRTEAWWQREARERRDDAIRTIAAKFFPDQCHSRQAREIAIGLRRYEGSIWRDHRAWAKPPQAIIGTEREIYFWILKDGEAPGTRQITRILSNA